MPNHLQAPNVSNQNRDALKIALLYLAVGILWILFSDELAAKIAPNPAVLTMISIYKGWGYVVVTTLMLYWLISRDSSRRRQTEKKLHESEQNYQEFLDQVSDGIFIADASGRYTLVNQEACRLVGYSKAELLAMNLRELVAPDDLKRMPLRLDELQSGQTIISEHRLVRKDGSYILCEISGKMLPDGRFQSLVRDITERKTTQEALVKSEKRYRSLFENMTNGFARCQMLYKNGKPVDFIYLDINQAFKELTGLQNVIGKRVSEAIPGIQESNPEIFEIYGRVALTGKPEKFETHVPELDSGIWFSVSVYSTEKDFFVAVFEVITERKQAEEKLRESELRYRSLIEVSPDAIFINRENQIVFINRRGVEILGASVPEQILGKSPFEIFHPDAHAALRERIKHLLTFKVANTPIEEKIIRLDGKVILVEAVAAPIMDGGIAAIQVVLRDITERKQAEEQLAYQAYLLANLNDAITASDEKAVLTVWNGGAENMFGWKAAEVLGRSGQEVFRSEFLGIERAEVFRTVNETGQFRGEMIQYRKDGTPIHVEANTHALYNEEKQVTGYVTVSRDISERKHAEQALQASEKKYSAIFEKSVVPCALTKLPEVVFVDINEAFEATYGYSREDVIGKTSLEIGMARPEERAQTYDAVMRYGVSRDNEKHLFTKAGEIRIGAINASQVEIDGQGFVVTTIHDVTERKLAETQLEYQAHLLSNVSDAIIATDEKQVITAWNHAAEEMYGWLAEEAIGKLAQEAIRSEFSDLQRTEAIKALKETGHFKVETLQYHRNGQAIWVGGNTIALHDDTGKLTGFVSANRNITERKHAEEELKRSNAELEQFAYVASHDLQEPLRAVAGMVQLLGQRYKGKLDERADEYIGHAVEAATRMQNLINDLLDYSRVGRQGNPFEATLLENPLNMALANLQAAIQESHAQITVDPLPTLQIDPAQMSRVFQNLIGNAIKFKGERPLHIHIGASQIERTWQFTVSDNGIGIEPQYFERIFLVFQRLHTRREYAGTGIGLALCKKIIERHGGRIWVESQPGQGSTFYFTIPER